MWEPYDTEAAERPAEVNDALADLADGVLARIEVPTWLARAGTWSELTQQLGLGLLELGVVQRPAFVQVGQCLQPRDGIV